ncbi:hypothetical protein [Catellatospora sichuanensis]|uniref:hypothetical protein n=1 Tax=Catellatospora sichuanensis TaxID=1969805 RepID=UPI0011844371|nr:hypothetical protein [Catellatospora sichuanensis]
MLRWNVISRPAGHTRIIFAVRSLRDSSFTAAGLNPTNKYTELVGRKLVITSDAVYVMVGLMGSTISLIGLVVRLRYRLRSERERRRYLLVAATTLPGGSRIQ